MGWFLLISVICLSSVARVGRCVGFDCAFYLVTYVVWCFRLWLLLFAVILSLFVCVFVWCVCLCLRVICVLIVVYIYGSLVCLLVCWVACI